jgi:hypothetical protein
MQTRRWVNPSQPQTLQLAVWLSYFWAVSILIFGFDYEYSAFPGSSISRTGAISNPLLRIGLPILLAYAAWLTANERKNGWKLAVALAALPLVLRLMLGFGLSFGVDIGGAHINPIRTDIIGLMFDVARFALLVHPRSREYERIWFQ